MKIFKSIIWLIVIGPLSVNAQQVDLNLASKIAPSVLSRLYNLTSKIKLPAEKQAALASLFIKEDSLVTASILQKASSATIDKLHANFAEQRVQLFNVDELAEWNKSQILELNYTESSQRYFELQLAELNSIRPISTQEKELLLKRFILLCKSREETYAGNFQEALSATIPDTILFSSLYKSQIKFRANTATRTYPITNDLPPIVLAYASQLIYEYQKALEVAKMTYINHPKELERFKTDINAYFKPKIENILLRNGINMPSTRFANAILHRNALKLNETQLDQLVEACRIVMREKLIFRLENPEKTYSSKGLERNKLPQILTATQYDALVQLEAMQTVNNSVNDRWDLIVKNRLNSGLDSNIVKQQLFNYFMSKRLANDKYSSDKIQLRLVIDSIEKNRPIVLNKLDALPKNRTGFTW